MSLKDDQRTSRSVTHDAVAEGREFVHDAVELIKPRLRGWSHAVMWPLAIAAGSVLIALAPTATARVGAAIFAASGILLFGGSALMHTGTWSRRIDDLLRRVDHANIFLLIAGSYTPLALLLLDGADRVILLSLIWSGAALGVIFRTFWLTAPRWLYTPLYLLLGWVAVFWIFDIFASGGVAIATLTIIGGGLYSVGAIVYGTKWPDPAPRWFGFHEIFHVFVVAAWIIHYIAISMAVYGAR